MTEQTLYRRNFLLHLQERQEYDELVLLKEPAHERLTEGQIGQLHNEYAISRQLDDVAGVRPAYRLKGSESHPVLLLKYIQGDNLSEIAQKPSLELPEKLQLAVELSAILGRIHDAGVMHRDISSSNIMIADAEMPGENGRVTIIDFGLAMTRRQEELAQPIAPDVLAGTLAYISPEQTGRINRAVDYRSDLYSLGVTLYELFTGQLPFRTSDTLEMIHAHIAVQPDPPDEHDEEIPQVLSQIILKLLAKNAEDRYQSAQGLSADLERCRDQLQKTGAVESFALGRDDFSRRLQIPQKLYGRQAEIKQLIDTYERACQGNPKLLFIAGYSGVGKTALVHEMRREVLLKRGTFIEGKFDQLQRTLPYSAWELAFTQLANNWLAASEANLANWRETILEAVGDNGQVLIDVIPALERVIGPQPEVPQLGSLENQNRFNYTFNRFISGLATPESPLVVFLDDLQWIDPASLSLIEVLMAVQSKSSLLILGAYRDNEVGADHPLAASQERMIGDGDQIRIITLADLKPADTDQLLADTLQLATADCRDLSQILQEKTAGNPFYFRQQLYALEAGEQLYFDREQGRWVWEKDLQRSLEVGDNVVDLMVRKIRTLPLETQQTLSMAACIGNRFEVSTLDTVTGKSQMAILTDLNPALQSGLIIRSNGYFSFAHDRIQEAGYSLIPKADLPRTHLEIGCLLRAGVTDENLGQEIFAIVGHLNAGRDLITTESEKLDLVGLNLKAGQKAKAATAYSEAKSYIEIGLNLLGSDSWLDQYELTLSLHNEDAELASLTGQFDKITQIADAIRTNARNLLDQVQIFMIQIEAKTLQYNFPDALQIGLDVLRDLDIEIPTQPTVEDYKRLHAKTTDLLTERPLEMVDLLPEMTDEKALALSHILAAEMSTSYIVDPPLYPIISYQGALLTLEYGRNAWSPFFFAGVALVAFSAINHETPIDDAHDFLVLGKQMQAIAREMLKNPDTVHSRTKTLQILGEIEHWTEPIHTALETAQATFQSRVATGDVLYSAYGTIHAANHGLAAGIQLETYQRLISDFSELLVKEGQRAVVQWLSIFLQTGQCFQEESEEPHKLSGSYLDEDAFLQGAAAVGDIPGQHFLYTFKLLLSYHFNVDSKLEEYIIKAEKNLPGGFGMISYGVFYFYSALARIRLHTKLEEEPRTEDLDRVDSTLRLMKIWSEMAPYTFQNKADLLEAERARLLGDMETAVSHYEQAIRGANESGLTHEEALANELYARYWADRNIERFASQLMREAHSLYRKWGAFAKAEHLTQRYPTWLVSKRITTDSLNTGTSTLQATRSFDILTILKTSQAIASEIELGRLLVLLMNSAIENSGAQSGYLLLPEAGEWMIAARADSKDSDLLVEQPLSVTENRPLSQGIVNYVARTQQTVLLDNAIEQGDYVDDPHIQRQKVKSLLCTPLVNQGKTSAILYLENNLAPGVFTPERIELLNLLSSQMAISVDNARLLEERAQALRSAETQIRLMFENSPVSIALSTVRGDILTFNKALLEMLRISEEELLREGAVNFYADAADRAKLLAAVQESGSVQQFGVPLVRHDGSSFFGSVNMSRLVLEGNEVLLTMVEDVTDEITAEQQAAVIEERERLARELHDSVTQTLFSASVLAQSAPRLLEKNPTAAQQSMEQQSLLIRGALAEMRTLLFELRPSEFTAENLAQMFELLAESARARTRAEVNLNVQSKTLPPQDVVTAFYRIAQEALNNTAKHAMAGEVTIDFACDGEGARLAIKDDGKGFDIRDIPPGHLGVGIMGERAHLIGAEMEISSEIGEGTEVLVSWLANGGRREDA